MAYNELIKNFEKVRAYMREFYVYGFKSRTEYDAKSARSYDDERRRLESWLGDYMQFTQTPEGKNVFLSVDSRVTRKNPFYKAWKARTAKGTSVLFYYLIDLGYVAGAAAKLIMIFSSSDPWYVTVKWYVITIYIINFLMVATGILIYYRNRALDEKAAEETAKRLAENKFDMNDLLQQFESIKKMGGALPRPIHCGRIKRLLRFSRLRIYRRKKKILAAVF